MHSKNTKIVCTLGPASDSEKEILKLVKAGMNIARLNFSHGTYKHHKKLIRNIHKVEKITGQRIGILQDLQGPKVRIGKMPEEGIEVKKNEKFLLSISAKIGIRTKEKTIIPIKYKGIIKDAKKSDTILINDGLIETKVIKKGKDYLECKAINAGTIKTGNGVNIPTGNISQPAITKKDKEDLKFGLKNNVDFIAISFVKSEKDIENLRELIKKLGKDTKIIAKIERHEAVKNLKAIIKTADGVMVARGDLGVDIPAEQVPIVQKRIIALANKFAKPVITATQVLYSMVEKATATRAEISDAANAVFDHTDAIMLSNETAVGKYPFRATKTLTKVALIVEEEMQKHEELIENLTASKKHLTPLNATCLNACELAVDSNADALVVYTKDGYTAQQIAKHRPYTPIITIAKKEKTLRELTVVWGLNNLYKANISGKGAKKIEKILNFLRKNKLVKKGQKIVIVCNASQKEKLISTFTI